MFMVLMYTIAAFVALAATAVFILLAGSAISAFSQDASPDTRREFARPDQWDLFDAGARRSVVAVPMPDFAAASPALSSARERRVPQGTIDRFRTSTARGTVYQPSAVDVSQMPALR